jgi:hypothetical protein
MDPYLEHHNLWSEFHSSLAFEIRNALNPQIQPQYVARVTAHVAYDDIEIARAQRAEPDVGIFRSQPHTPRDVTATMTATPATVESRAVLTTPLRLYRVEIHQTDSFELVTVIEILSPINKRRKHPERNKYLRKRRDLLQSPIHFIEIDWLRGGERSPLQDPVPLAPYYITLSREERRPTIEVWAMQLWDKLPMLPVPLSEPDPDVIVDLGATFTMVYDDSGYATLIDYHKPPPPPLLNKQEAAWLEEHLHAVGKRTGER